MIEFMKQVLPRLESPHSPGLALSDVPPPSLCEPKLYLVLIVLVEAGVGGVGIFRSLFVFSMAPVDDDVGPFEVDDDEVGDGAAALETLMASPEDDLARALLVLEMIILPLLGWKSRNSEIGTIKPRFIPNKAISCYVK
jgi:hypothetical protein